MQKGLSAADPSLSRGGTACSLLCLKSFKSYTLGHLNYRLKIYGTEEKGKYTFVFDITITVLHLFLESDFI